MQNVITAVKSTLNQTNVPAEIQVTPDFIEQADEVINAATVEETGETFGELLPGTHIYCGGYDVVKAKQLDGSWALV